MTADLFNLFALLCVTHKIIAMDANVKPQKTMISQVQSNSKMVASTTTVSSSVLTWINDYQRDYITEEETKIFTCVSNCLKIYFDPNAPVATTEVPVTLTTTRPTQCPTYTCKISSKSYAKKKGKTGGYERIGNGRFLSSCGRIYFFSKDKLLPLAAKEACCKMNMQLIKLDTTEKITCLNELAKSDNLILEAKFIVDGSQQFALTQFVWCDAGTPFARDIPWYDLGPIEPDNFWNLEQCVGISIKVNGKLYFFDWNCVLQYQYICEASV